MTSETMRSPLSASANAERPLSLAMSSQTRQAGEWR